MTSISSRSLVISFALLGALVPQKSHAQACVSNLMIVLDRSCSMTSNMIMGKSRWQIAVESINQLVTNNAGKLNFGLEMFPDKDAAKPQCVQTDPLLAPAPGNESMVTTLLANNTPGSPCVTNIDEGMKQAMNVQALYTTDRRSFAVLITDGSQSGCNGGPSQADPLTVQYITQMNNMKVPTYVVGFDVGTDQGAQNSLNMFAAAGGLPNPMGGTTTQYYPANDEAQLQATLAQLVGLTSGEISVCKGMPCPDNRCLTPGEMCVSGFCVAPIPDGGGSGNGDGGDGGTDGGTVASGCSCQLASHSTAPQLGLGVFLLCGILALRRRRIFG